MLEIDLSSTYTVSAWVRYNSTGNYKMYLGKDISPDDDSFDFGTNSTGKFYHAINDGAWAEYSSDVTPTTGIWYHVVWTRNGSSNLNFYLNGILSKSFTSVKVPRNSNINTYIGAAVTGGNMNGSIDDVRIYNRALSAAEIQALYNATK